MEDPPSSSVTYPYLIAEELIGSIGSRPKRYVIDFGRMDIFSARKYNAAFSRIEQTVLPARKMAFEKERERNEYALRTNPDAKTNHHHENFLNRWWQLSYSREKMIKKLSTVNRYVVCGQVTKRPIFEFVSNSIRPNAALIVFPMEDDFSFGVLQSKVHWDWFNATCSTLKDDPRYTSDSVFDTFPWPQWGIVDSYTDPMETSSFKKCVSIAFRVAEASRNLRAVRNDILRENKCSLRDLYRVLDLPGENSLRVAHESLDKAVLDAYTWGQPKGTWKQVDLELLLLLNKKCRGLEANGKIIFGPGLPKFCEGQEGFFSNDCIRML